MAKKSAKLGKSVKSPKPKIRVEEIVEEKPVPQPDPVDVSFNQPEVDPEVSVLTEQAEPKLSVVEAPEVVHEPVMAMDTPPEPPGDKMTSDEVKEWLKDIRPDTTKEVEKANGFDFKLFFGFLLLFALIGALIGGLYYYKQKVGGLSPTTSGTPTPEVTSAPEVTATPAPSVDLTKLKVSVLNGSGISGEAGRVEALLTKAGFSESGVTTGNASVFNHTTTSVMLKKSVSAEVFDKIKAALGSGYEVVKGVGDLNDSSTYDVEITVGKKG